MIHIFRPYQDNIKTASCLHNNDRAKMKLNSYIVLKTIYEKMGWLPDTGLSETYKDDTYVKFYYNEGAPCVDVLLEYYYTVYHYWLKACGDEVDFSKEFEKIYRANKAKCCKKDLWENSYCLMHRMYLLKYDHDWYKRHFRKHYVFKLDNYELFNGDEPRKLSDTELIRCMDYLPIDVETN